MKRMWTKKSIGETAVDSVSEAIESGVIDLGGGVKQLEFAIPASKITKVGQQWQTTKEYADKWATLGEASIILAVYFGFGGYYAGNALFRYSPDNRRLIACMPNISASIYDNPLVTDGAISITYTTNSLYLIGCNDEYASMDDVIADGAITYIKVLYI